LMPTLADGFRWSEAVPTAEAVLAEALRRGDGASEARARHTLGSALINLSRLVEGEAHVERAADLYRAAGAHEAVAETLDCLAQAAFYEGRIAAAQQFVQQALQVAREGDDRRGEAHRLINLAQIHLASGEHAAALCVVTDGLQLARRLRHFPGQAYGHSIMGQVLRSAGRYVEAIAAFDEGLSICWSQGLRAREAYILYRVGQARLDLGEAESAANCAERSAAIGLEIGDDYHRARALALLGRACDARDDQARAHASRTEARELLDRLGIPDDAEATDLPIR